MCKIDKQQQLDEDEDEGAHDATVEPDWGLGVGHKGGAA